jgi:hypothetical protein
MLVCQWRGTTQPDFSEAAIRQIVVLQAFRHHLN